MAKLEFDTVEKVYKKTLRAVIISQILGGAGLAAGITVGALIAQEMLGTDKFSGIPSALFTFGSAGAALLVGKITQQKGRRIGLSFGFFIGGIGALGIILSTVINSVSLLFLSLLIYGSGTATNLQARYAGTDLAPEKKRATAVSIAMVSTTLGALVGPNLVGPMGNLAKLIHVPELAGIFILAAVAFFSAGTVLFLLLKPDPYLLAKQIEEEQAIQSENKSTSKEISFDRHQVISGAIVMVTTQMIMVAIMTMTPIHMRHHNHPMNAVGLVIGIHIASMYLPSLLTGALVNKLGSKNVGIVSGITLFLAGLVTMTAPNDSLFVLILGLSLLGIGWDFGLISGTTAIVNATSASIRPKIQSKVDVFISLAGAIGGVLSGVIVNYSNYSILSLLGVIISSILVVVIWLDRK